MKQPHLRSYEKVNGVVTRDRAISKRLSGKVQKVELASGRSGEYPKEVVELVQLIHGNNLDAVTLSPGEILRHAMQYFGLAEGPLKKTEKVEAAPAAAAKPAVKRVKRARPAKAAAPAPVEAADENDQEPEPPSPVTAEEQQSNPVEEDDTEKPVQDIIKLPKEWDRTMPYVPGTTICSLLVSALGLAEAYDRNDGHAERSKELNAVLIKFQRVTTIPKSSAKEAVK